jgi:GNAT superfamily N-acetyltransferase
MINVDAILIREARAGDVAGMFAVRTSVVDNAMGMERLAELGISPESVAASLARDHKGWVAEGAAGEVVGFAMGDRADGSVFALFVRPGWERRGIGGRLLGTVVAWLRREGHNVVRLTTGARTPAEGFYRRRGWVEAGRDPDGQVRLELRRDRE